jgi:predicted porin
MKLRLLAMTGLVTAIISSPAIAGDGWYLGIATGWDHGTGVRFNSPRTSPPSSISDKNSSDPIVTASAGYKWDIGLRIELEEAYTVPHTFHSSTNPNTTDIPPFINNVVNSVGGSSSVTSTDFNLLYDLPLSDRWSVSAGAGYGVGYSNVKATANISSTPSTTAGSPAPGAGHTTTASGELGFGSKMGLESQLIVGINYVLTPNIDLYIDGRRRSNEINRSLTTSFSPLAPVYIASVSDDSVMIGLRWYPGSHR